MLVLFDKGPRPVFRLRLGGIGVPQALQWKPVKVRDLVKLIEADGWRHVRTTGSHRHYKHPSKPSVVTIPGHPGDDVPPGTLKSIQKAAGLEKRV